jgi:hypothetical protein
MNSILVSLVVFACVFVGAMIGTALHAKLPEHHRDGDSREVIKLVMGLIATIAALVLSLLIASGHSSYDTQESEVRQLAAHLGLVDRMLANYGPETAEARALLRSIVAADMARIWSETGDGKANLPSFTDRMRGEDVFRMIVSLSPGTDAQRFSQARALQTLTEMTNTRRLMSEQASGALAWPFFVVLVFWLIVLFLGFGLFTRFNATVFAAFFIGALSVGGAIFLILEMNTPYSGVMQISNAPMRRALDELGK